MSAMITRDRRDFIYAPTQIRKHFLNSNTKQSFIAVSKCNVKKS